MEFAPVKTFPPFKMTEKALMGLSLRYVLFNDRYILAVMNYQVQLATGRGI